jgi:formylglycine-generating enzyme required for sulfatase activity
MKLMSHFSFLLFSTILIFSTSCKDDEPDAVTFGNVLIPAGIFTMGSPLSEIGRGSDEIQHQVTLIGFYMTKYEVTNAEYAAFLNAKNIGSNGKYANGAYSSQVLIYPTEDNYDWGLHYTDSKWVPVAGFENSPIVFVTWYGATEYANYVGGSHPLKHNGNMLVEQELQQLLIQETA